MNIFDWKCECGKDSSTMGDFEEFIPYTDSRSHNPDLCDNPICECGKPLVSFASEAPNFDKERKIDAVFDFHFQIWRKLDGSPILDSDVKAEWSFPCSSCEGPADMTSCDSYHEHYKCLNCNHTFKVN